MRKIIFLLLILVPFQLQSQETKPKTHPAPKATQSSSSKISLRECYELSVKYMETVQISDQEIQVAKARFSEVLGEIIPRVRIFATEFLQDDHANTPTGTTTGQVVNTFTRFSRPEVGVNVTQNLFRGFREITAMRLAKTDERMQGYNKEDVERLLYEDVAVAFYTVMQAEQDVASNQKVIKAYKDRILELNKRIELGKSRESEVLAQESDLGILEGTIERDKGRVIVAYQMLSFLTGLDPHPRIQWDDPSKYVLKPLPEYTALAEGRADVMSSKMAVDMAKGKVKYDKGALLPDAGADFNAYMYRVGFQENIFWDANFRLNVPVFNWSTYGLIRESKAKALQSELQLQLLKRQAVRDIKNAYERYSASMIEYQKYFSAAQKSDASYRQQIQDYNMGLINNLDVIYAMNTWLVAVRQRDDSKVRLLANWVSLHVTSGIKP